MHRRGTDDASVQSDEISKMIMRLRENTRSNKGMGGVTQRTFGLRDAGTSMGGLGGPGAGPAIRLGWDVDGYGYG